MGEPNPDGGAAPPDRVGVVGPDPEPVADRIREAGTAAPTGGPAAVLEAGPDAVVALGEEALLEAAVLTGDTPLLAVDGPRGALAVPRSALDDAVARLLAGGWSTRRRPLVRATAGDREVRALLEMALLAAPLGMSEFGIASVDAAGDRLPVDRFRADGVVVATPAGSTGYAHDAGGVGVAPGVPAASVVPVAPFTIERERWVVGYPVTVTVEREEGAVSLYADGRAVGPVGPGTPVVVEPDGGAVFVALPGRRPHFRRAGRLEKT